MVRNGVAYALSAVAVTLGSGILAPAVFADAQDLTADLSLTASVTDCYTVKSGNNVTIDLGGYDIECTGANAILVENGAVLTVKGNGNVSTSTAGRAAIYNNIGGTVTVEGGNYNSTNWYTVKNLGTMTIKDGTFSQGENNTSNSSLVDNGWYNSENGGASDQGNAHTGDIVANMVIDGGTFNHYTTTSTIKSDDYSKTTINGGAFNSQNGYLLQATGDVTVNGGTFRGYNSMIVFNATGDAGYEPGIATINDGDINAKYVASGSKGVLKVTGGKFVGLSRIVYYGNIAGEGISGGRFNIDPEAARVADGHVSILVDEGLYEVQSRAVIEEGGYDVETDEEGNNVVLPKEINMVENGAMESDGSLAGALYGSAVFTSAFDADRKAYFELLTLDNNEVDALELDSTGGGDLILSFDASLWSDRSGSPLPIDVHDTSVTIRVVLTDEQYDILKSYDEVKVVYFGDDGKEAGRFDAVLGVDGDKYYIEFTTTHLSTYGVVGVNEVEEEATVAETPDTGTMTAAGASASIAAMAAAVTVGMLTSIVSFTYLMRRRG